MQIVPLSSDPNQELTVRQDGFRYSLRLKSVNGVMVVDISVDGVVILFGSRVLAGTPLIPYRYLEDGNFLLLTNNEELPDYTQFGLTQTLVYLSPDEIAAL
jgi:hypothetical protein